MPRAKLLAKALGLYQQPEKRMNYPIFRCAKPCGTALADSSHQIKSLNQETVVIPRTYRIQYTTVSLTQRSSLISHHASSSLQRGQTLSKMSSHKSLTRSTSFKITAPRIETHRSQLTLRTPNRIAIATYEVRSTQTSHCGIICLICDRMYASIPVPSGKS